MGRVNSNHWAANERLSDFRVYRIGGMTLPLGLVTFRISCAICIPSNANAICLSVSIQFILGADWHFRCLQPHFLHDAALAVPSVFSKYFTRGEAHQTTEPKVKVLTTTVPVDPVDTRTWFVILNVHKTDQGVLCLRFHKDARTEICVEHILKSRWLQ